MAKVIVVANQKGGVGKSATSVNLGIGLARMGKAVCLIDMDAQANLTMSLGYKQPDELDKSIVDVFQLIINDQPVPKGFGLLHHAEGVDLLPSNIQLSGMETMLVNAMSRESILKRYVEGIRSEYDYAIIDTAPSLGMLTINALNAADNVIIPTHANYLSTKGMELLLDTVDKVKRNLNPNLTIEGIVITMLDNRAKFRREIVGMIRDNFGDGIRVFNSEIPLSVRAEETGAIGKSIYEYDPHGKVAKAYGDLTKEVLSHGEARQRGQAKRKDRVR